MCLILLALQSHPSFPLVFLANRDEFYERPSKPTAFWEEAPHVLAGRDLKAGGTWFGITRSGRIAAVTNYRDPASLKTRAPSRGQLVSDFLLGEDPPADYIRAISRRAHEYNGFNLVLGTWRELYWYSNRGGNPHRLDPGIHGLSNCLLNTDWYKVQYGKEKLAEMLSGHGNPDPAELFALLASRSVPDEAQLPDTGVGPEWERVLAPLFIASPAYGTRSSLVLLVDRNGYVSLAEKTFNGEPDQPSTATYEFQIRQETGKG